MGEYDTPTSSFSGGQGPLAYTGISRAEGPAASPIASGKV